jgi:hypothetical protein
MRLNKMKEVYFFDPPSLQRGTWHVANLLTDPLYWYIVNIYPGERVRLGLSSLISYSQAIEEAKKRNAEDAGKPGTKIRGTETAGVEVQGKDLVEVEGVEVTP